MLSRYVLYEVAERRKRMFSRALLSVAVLLTGVNLVGLGAGIAVALERGSLLGVALFVALALAGFVLFVGALRALEHHFPPGWGA